MKAILLITFIGLCAVAWAERYFPTEPQCPLCHGQCTRIPEYPGWYECRNCSNRLQGKDYRPERVR